VSSVGRSTTRLVGLSFRAALTARLADYLELTKPRIAVMAMFAVAVGYALASEGPVLAGPLFPALCGIGLVAVASSMINQWMERETDARMHRTAERPIPSGRILPGEALSLGLACGVVGTLCLLLTVNRLTALLALATFASYTLVYTPLKRRTSLCTALGAIPGALPPVLGWTAAGGQLDGGAFALFCLLFLWQFPHFLAIAWLYRDDYSRAALKMLPHVVQSGQARHVTGCLAAGYAAALIPASLLVREWGLAGARYTVAAIVLGIGYLLMSLAFARNESRESARRLLYYSLVYLPLLLIVLTWDHWSLLR
jgi:heme o synthase